MKIKIKKDPCGIINAILLIMLVERFLESFGFPHAFIFLLDALNFGLLIYLISARKINKWFIHPVLKWQMFIFTIGIVTALMNSVPILQIIWSLRNLLRFHVFFLACSEYLRLEDIKKIFDIMMKLFYINIVIFLFEFFLLDFSGDYLGGIFGTRLGANAFMNIFLIVVFTYQTMLWMAKKEKLSVYLWVVFLSVVQAVLCELKMFFVEIAIILILAFVINMVIEKKWKILLKFIGIGSVETLGLIVGINVLGRLYPNFADFFTIEKFLYATTRISGYSGAGDLNRLTAIATINNRIFTGSITRVFGMGLGAAEYSTSISVVTGWFYETYNYLHYYWFSHAWMYLECGVIGLIGYMVSFYAQGFQGIKLARLNCKNSDNYVYLITASIICFMTLAVYIYNQSLRLEIAYLLYFCFAIIPVVRREC